MKSAPLSTPLRFVGIDEGRQRLSLFDTDRHEALWSLDLAERPVARDLQRLDPDTVLVGYDRGFFEIEASTGRILSVCDRWTNVTSVQRQANGTTLVTGINLAGLGGLNVLTLDAENHILATAHRDGNYVRLMRTTGEGTYLLCTNDHILETAADLSEIQRLTAPGFLHAWLATRRADRTTLVSAGYGAFLSRFDADGDGVRSFGGRGEVPDAVEPHFYAAFQETQDGRIVVANWQGHGPDNGAKGHQLIEFSPAGIYLGSWSHPDRISSLQGLLLV